ncbi:MAG: iron-only hydrogenase system regulator [Oscillospiraceae bacterium]|nr:iron-only hydrogenase system regulator [Oscillospiraceae bacterium]
MLCTGGIFLEANRIAVLGVIVEDMQAVPQLNELLHAYAPYIIGRMGLPCRERHVSIISVVLDAPQPVVSALSGKLGQLPGVSAKATYSKNTGHEKERNLS